MWVVEDVGIIIDGVLWWMTVFLLDRSDRFLSGPYVQCAKLKLINGRQKLQIFHGSGKTT